MPNWCANQVTFWGGEEAVGKLSAKLINPVKLLGGTQSWLQPLSFEQPPWEFGEEFISDLSPGESAMSRTLGFLDKSTFQYNKMTMELGTKWDFTIYGLDVSANRINGRFQSAWAPPEGWFRLVCEHYQVDGDLSSGEQGNDYGCLLSIRGDVMRAYGSPYNHWACLEYEDREDFLSSLLSTEGEFEEYIEAVKKESTTWPKSWEEYKERFHEDTRAIEDRTK